MEELEPSRGDETNDEDEELCREPSTKKKEGEKSGDKNDEDMTLSADIEKVPFTAQIADRSWMMILKCREWNLYLGTKKTRWKKLCNNCNDTCQGTCFEL